MSSASAYLIGLNILGAGLLVFVGCMAIRQGLVYIAEAIRDKP